MDKFLFGKIGKWCLLGNGIGEQFGHPSKFLVVKMQFCASPSRSGANGCWFFAEKVHSPFVHTHWRHIACGGQHRFGQLAALRRGRLRDGRGLHRYLPELACLPAYSVFSPCVYLDWAYVNSCYFRRLVKVRILSYPLWMKLSGFTLHFLVPLSFSFPLSLSLFLK